MTSPAGSEKSSLTKRRGVGLLRRSRAGEQREWQAFEPAGEVEQPAQRGLVGPVQVVDDKQRRVPKSEVGSEPVEAVQHRERRFRAPARRVRRSRGEQRRAQRSRTCKQVGADILRRSSEGGLEELANDPKGKLALELASPSTQHLDLGPLGKLPGRPQQPCLTDACGPLDNDETTLAAARSVEQPLQHSEFRLTFEHEARSSAAW